MNPEIAEYARSIESTLAKIGETLRPLSAAQLNARPPIEGGNSAWVIATHTAGNARAWMTGIVPGVALRRDRASEFASRGESAEELIAHLRQTAADARAALEALDPARLEIRITPPQELWGEGTAVEMSVRECIMHVIEHASMHLGHLHVTCDWVRSST